MENLFILAAVTGAVEFIRRVRTQDWFGAATIAVAAAIGAASGYFQLGGVDIFENGLILGLGASGLVTFANQLGTSYTLRENRPV